MSTCHKALPLQGPQKSGSPGQGIAIFANNSAIPPRTLNNIMKIIEARSGEVLQKWQAYFGRTDYYC